MNKWMRRKSKKQRNLKSTVRNWNKCIVVTHRLSMGTHVFYSRLLAFSFFVEENCLLAFTVAKQLELINKPATWVHKYWKPMGIKVTLDPSIDCPSIKQTCIYQIWSDGPNHIIICPRSSSKALYVHRDINIIKLNIVTYTTTSQAIKHHISCIVVFFITLLNLWISLCLSDKSSTYVQSFEF